MSHGYGCAGGACPGCYIDDDSCRVTAAPKLVICSTCGDTHRMTLGDREVPCTRCPTPCDACRTGGRGAYCEQTPCSCECHLMSLFGPYALTNGTGAKPLEPTSVEQLLATMRREVEPVVTKIRAIDARARKICEWLVSRCQCPTPTIQVVLNGLRVTFSPDALCPHHHSIRRLIITADGVEVERR